MRFRPNADALEDRRLMSFGGGNIDYSIPRYPSTSPSLNFTSNSFHSINATIPQVASTIVQTPASADAQLATYVAHIPNGTTSLLPILEADVATFESSTSTTATGYTATQANTTITTLYDDLLGFAPDAPALTAGAAALQSGVTVPMVANVIVQSSSFLTNNTTAGASAAANNTQFVTALYELVLGRAPDPVGLPGWVGLLDSGSLSTAQVANDFIYSAEAATSSISIFADVKTAQASQSITTIYSTLFGFAPDAPALSAGTAALQSGVSVQTVADVVAQSSAFLAINTTAGATAAANNTQFVTALYDDVLGRAPDAVGLPGWVSLLNAGTLTTTQVANDFVYSAEAETSSVSVLQKAELPVASTKYYFGTVVPNGTITGNFTGTSKTVQLENLIQQDTLAYLANGIGNSFNILKSSVGWASDSLLTYNGHV